MFQTKPTWRDLLAAGAVLLLACALFCVPLTAKTGAYVEITTPDGVQVYSLSEARELTFSSNGVTLTVVIGNGEVFVKESDCPDGVCVAGGRISKSGETVLCAPAKILLTVKGGDGNVDFVAG